MEWLTADEWFADYLLKLHRSGPRRSRLWQEWVIVPTADKAARAYQDKTEQLSRMLRRGRAESRPSSSQGDS